MTFNKKTHHRLGHPALSQALLVPMVHAKVSHLLPNIYNGEYEISGRGRSVDAKIAVVSDSEIDYSHYKDRPEFQSETSSICSDTTMLNKQPDPPAPRIPTRMPARRPVSGVPIHQIL